MAEIPQHDGGLSEVMVQLGTFDTYDDGLEHAPRGHVEVEDMLKPVVRIAQVLLYIVRAEVIDWSSSKMNLVRALRSAAVKILGHGMG